MLEQSSLFHEADGTENQIDADKDTMTDARSLLSIESLDAGFIRRVLALSVEMKATRGRHAAHPLRHQCWGMLFSKTSTRTRVSFEVAVRELGGDPIFMAAADIQLGRGEPIGDTARVMGRMLHGAIIRTYAQADVEEFAAASGLPTINALTDAEHPCQILADLFTIEEKRGPIEKQVVCFVGDGDCNVARSWLWAAAHLGFELRIAAPEKYQIDAALRARAGAGNVHCFSDPVAAAQAADVVYTDVWVSMGKEAEMAERFDSFGAYQINQRLLAAAQSDALVMHCLPAYRGKEITAEAFDAHSQTIFDQAENRLHVQKAILALLA